jgi:hypothetical protein
VDRQRQVLADKPMNTAYDFPELFRDFAFMPKFSDDIDHLSQLAESEAWDYQRSPSPHTHPILRNYVSYTYRRVAEEKKINITPDEENCCWNTGLITPTQEPIFILFSKNRLPNATSYWHFWKFARKGEWELNRFAALPDMAHYFEDPSVLVFDTRKELRVNVEHVVSDNFGAIPCTASNNESVRPTEFGERINRFRSRAREKELQDRHSSVLSGLDSASAAIELDRSSTSRSCASC